MMKTTQSYTVAGTNAHRVDGVEKVTGKAVYTGDIQLPGMAYAKILRSPVPHARLIKVDASKAKELPGVIATLTRDDIKGFAYKYGATYKDQSIVAVEKVRYVGDPVAAVLAEDPAHWRSTPSRTLSKSNTKSCPKLRILKKRLRPVLSRFTRAAWRARNCAARFMARRKDSRGTNICYYLGFSRGDIDKGFAESDLVFEDTFRFQKVQHYSLEAHINIAYYDGEKLTMWSSCQDPFTLRDHLSGIFHLPLSRVRVIVPYVGGGYGGKLYVKGEPIAAALSWMTRRPVKLSFSVNESFKTVTRHPARVTDQDRRQERRLIGGAGNVRSTWTPGPTPTPDHGSRKKRGIAHWGRTKYPTPKSKPMAFTPIPCQRGHSAGLARCRSPGPMNRKWI